MELVDTIAAATAAAAGLLFLMLIPFAEHQVLMENYLFDLHNYYVTRLKHHFTIRIIINLRLVN